ncbi:prolipoprotein diacylglyceryl transferase [Saccharomonospora saliphila]|uniref:hypothetical protein n=1 Tax=Saccharomonospora saliphila TaxID=369829 RepID=UPI00036003EE|nr:hypothetical protein [Saccharomonospora saliphila]
MGTTRTDEERTVLTTAVGQMRTSLLAALGAGNLAGQAVADAVAKARTRLNESSETARRTVEDLPTELESLRGRLDPAELRKLVDDYTDSALRLYHRLAENGEQTWDRLSEQPQVRRGREQVGEALHAAQERVDGVTTDARVQLDELVSLLTRRTREAGHDAGRATAEAGDRAADAISDVTEPVRAGTSERTDKPGPAAFDRASDDEASESRTAPGTRTPGTGTSGATASGSGRPARATTARTAEPKSAGTTSTGAKSTEPKSAEPKSAESKSTEPKSTSAKAPGTGGAADTGSADTATEGGQSGKTSRGGAGTRRTQSRRSPNGTRGSDE